MNFTSPYTEDNPLPGYYPRLFRIEGEISDLVIERTTENLLAKMQHASGLGNIATATAAAYSGMYGVLANSGMLAAYDGEEVYSFVCLLDGQPMLGQFEAASELRNGDKVIAVVSRHNGVLNAHALMHQETGNFMMPLNVFAAEPSMKREAVMHGVRMTIAISIAFFICSMIMVWTGDIKTVGRFATMLSLGTLAAAGVMTVSQFFEYHSFSDGPSEADSIFRVFGFPNPTKIDLRQVGVLNDKRLGWRGAFRSDTLIERMRQRRLIK